MPRISFHSVSRAFSILVLLAACAQADPVVYPYLQNVTPTSAQLYWVDDTPQSVTVTWSRTNEADARAQSKSVSAPELGYQAQELLEFPDLTSTPLRYLHCVTLTDLKPGTEVNYQVAFPTEGFREMFRTLPDDDQPIRIIAYADSETEPESTGKPAKWGTEADPDRRYLVDQTTGYRENLNLIRQRKPQAVLIAGDLVESGGEQRDWDEFWKQNKVLAGAIPILPAPGNHEYWAGPKHGGYTDSGGRWAINKYRTYFHPKGEAKARHYYEQELGKVTILSLDSGDGLPSKTSGDSNFYLSAAPDFGVDFHPESEQGRWLESKLKKAQKQGQFVIVMFHHCPYSSGTHGFPAGSGPAEDEQSGQPLRALTPLFLKYGVELVLTGHDEMFEHSIIEGTEELPNQKKRPHQLHIYDVGVGGDGLRGPKRVNTYKKFLAYEDSPEVWSKGVLQKGGRHYGHLEVDVTPDEKGSWTAKVTPVYILPKEKRTGWSFHRQIYSDVLDLISPRLP